MKISDIPTPAYVVDEKKLEENLRILKDVSEQGGCKILLAQKAFSMFAEYPLIGKYLDGTTASGLYEARLGAEEMKKENHVFAPAYREDEIDEIASICDHVIFNSVSQVRKFGARVSEKAGRPGGIGLRINPECSTQDHAIYDPCAPFSRLGVTIGNLENALREDDGFWSLVSGLHVHTLCEQNSDALEETVRVIEEKFGKYLAQPGIKWLNLGGGHHITRDDYDRERLIRIVRHLRDTYRVEVYLEPGEAVALNAGYLVTEVLDQVDNILTTLLLDASAACHMPDVLEMPYQPPLKGAVAVPRIEDPEAAKTAGCNTDIPDKNRISDPDGCPVQEDSHIYRLSSCTCLAGDVIGDYRFNHPVRPGDRLCFEDMAIYSMVKNNTFNGMALPSIWKMDAGGDCILVKKFGYEDFKGRLS
nr:carboxynorspermidine decarboxylase [[Eubacterium] cellulosolvens]